MIDCLTILKIIIIVTFIVILILRANGPTRNKAAIDRSIAFLKERLTPPVSTYAPDPVIYDQFKDNCTDPALLTALAYDILRHCGMEPHNLTVTTKTDMGLRHAAGTYSSDGINSVITILVTPSSRYNIIHSVLIHECMHYFLFHTGIRKEETHENEILTDVATCYMGFYQFMYDGYLMVGYLRDSELKYVHKSLKNDNT